MKKYDKERLENEDKTNIWHPFTNMQDWIDDDLIIIKKGRGNYLFDVEGKKYLDGVSSLWTNIHGHNNKVLNKALCEQLKNIAHSTFLGLTHEPAIKFSKKLMDFVPLSLSRVFYSDSGSTAVEIAIKIAYQYWQQKGDVKLKSKKKFVSFVNAYHGDTIGAISVGGIDLFHNLYKDLLFESYKIESPYPIRQKLTQEESEKQSLEKLEVLLKAQHKNIAALIIEPLMQGAAGMLKTTPEYLKEVRRLAKEYNVLMIADEVATGFGRTGEMFACDVADVFPDIMCLAKGITGGYLPLAATLTSEEIFKAFVGDFTEQKTFFHGHTYTANPLACAVALASLELFQKNKIIGQIQSKIRLFENKLTDLENLPNVAEIRQTGLMIGIELCADDKTKQPYKPEQRVGYKVCREAIKNGVFLRPLGDVIVLMPPLSITHHEIEILIDVVKRSIHKTTKDL